MPSPYITPILIGALILVGSVTIFFQLSAYQNEIRESNKDKFAQIIENVMSRREGRIETIASSIIAFYTNSQKVETEEFDNFSEIILGKNFEILNVFTLVNNTITQSFPIKEYIGNDFDELFSTYPTEIKGTKAMTVEFQIDEDNLLIVAVPFDYFIQENTHVANNYKLVLLSPIDNDVRLYEIEKINGNIGYDVEFTEEELRDSITIEHQTTLFGHKIKQNYDLKYIIWDATFAEQPLEQISILIAGVILSVVIPTLLIRASLLKNQLQDKSKKLEELNGELIQVEKSKDEFVTMIVHDLKNPLVPIQAYTEMLLSEAFGALNEKQIARIQSIKNNADLLQKMIRDLLDANKLELGKLSLDIKPNNLAQIIRAEISNLESEFQNKEIAISFEPTADVLCECDKSRIGQVINNMLLNALDFVPQNTGKIEISLNADQKTAKISIKDNGVGIPKDKLDNLFVKFYQIRPNQNRKYGGTGLGLAVCKGIVEGHKGKIWAYSEGEGHGTEFNIEIPLAQK